MYIAILPTYYEVYAIGATEEEAKKEHRQRIQESIPRERGAKRKGHL